MENYLVPGGQAQAEYIEKKSRFIGQVFPITTEQEAKATIERVRRQHYDARHNCWCYILKSGQKRYSDDGEPQGTAGQPMLNVLDRERVVDVLCVVTRYFGGILLGAGGLCRAYTKAAKDALDAAGICKMQPWLRQTVSAPYALFERVKLLIAAQAGVPIVPMYSDARSRPWQRRRLVIGDAIDPRPYGGRFPSAAKLSALSDAVLAAMLRCKACFAEQETKK